MKVRSSDDGILHGIGRLRAGVDLLERSMRPILRRGICRANKKCLIIKDV